MTYVEQNSVVFDPDEETLETHKEIHDRYKQMVEALLASFLKDVCISEEDFMKACRAGGGSPQFSEVQKEIFEQVWAAEDFEVFRRLMVQKNIELQLQALQLIQQRCPGSLSPEQAVAPPVHQGATAGDQSFAIDEEAIMAEVIRRSKEEYESQQKSERDADRELEDALAKSQEAERQRLLEIAQREQAEMKRAIDSAFSNQKKKLENEKLLRNESTKLPAVKPPNVQAAHQALPSLSQSKAASKGIPETVPASKETGKAPSHTPPSATANSSTEAPTAADAAASWISSAREEAARASASKAPQDNEMTKEELKRREEYLKQQRDKLLAMKRQTREKHLTTFTEQQSKARPTSARTARRVTAGEQIESPSSTSNAEEQKKLAMRRALADALKREVIDKNQ